LRREARASGASASKQGRVTLVALRAVNRVRGVR
jgi:hypothetical protein